MTAIPSDVVRVPLSGVVFRRSIDRQLEAMCRDLGADSIDQIRNAYIHFDLSEASFLHLDATIWLIISIAQIRNDGNEVLLSLPEVESAGDSFLWSFLIRWGFFAELRKAAGLLENLLPHDQLHLVSEPSRYRSAFRVERHKEVPLFTHRLLPVVGARIPSDRGASEGAGPDDYDEVRELVRMRCDLMLIHELVTACDVNFDDAEQLIAALISETLFNASDHSRGSHAYLAMQVIEPKLASVARVTPMMVIVTVDNGIGIPEVLRSAKDAGMVSLADLPSDDAGLIRTFTDLDLLRDSIVVESSTKAAMRSSRGRAGMGLFEARQIVRRIGGSMRIRSGMAEVVFDPSGEATHDDGLTRAPGTSVRIEIPLKPTSRR